MNPVQNIRMEQMKCSSCFKRQMCIPFKNYAIIIIFKNIVLYPPATILGMLAIYVSIFCLYGGNAVPVGMSPSDKSLYSSLY